jgi:hypothetical protein
MIERALRAGAAIIAGLSIAWEHLRDEPEAEPAPLVDDPPPVSHPCPECGDSLVEGPHIHDTTVIWPTMHEGASLLTDLDGGDPILVPDSKP